MSEPWPNQNTPFEPSTAPSRSWRAFRELDGTGVSEIAERVDIGKSAAHPHLSTLASREYVAKEGDSPHRPLVSGPGRVRAQPDGDLRDRRARGREARGRDRRTRQPDGGEERQRHLPPPGRRRERGPVRRLRGEADHLHCTALGEAILAFRERGEVESILDDRGMERWPNAPSPTVRRSSRSWRRPRAQLRGRPRGADRRAVVYRRAGHRRRRPQRRGDQRLLAHRASDERFEAELPDAVPGTATIVELHHDHS